MIRILLAMMFLAPSLTAGFSAENAALDRGRQKSLAFLRGEYRTIWDDMTPDMQKALGNVEALGLLHRQLVANGGEENKVLDERTERQGDISLYTRTSAWTKVSAPILMQWAFDTKGRVAGFFVRQAPVAAESHHLDYITKAPLRLPFEGEWQVFWGGRTLEQNYHAADRAQRFAYDFVIRKDGVTFSGDAHALESYFCWDRPILAPADGLVVSTVDGLPDQKIGERDLQNPAGNHVVLDVGKGEFAFLAHFRKGSLAVAEGDRVAAGQQLGRCGNSGNSSEPHLHFHLQTSQDIGAGDGLPAFFTNYLVDGKPVTRGEPRKGEMVKPTSGK